ncbi:hypothetical protein ACFW2Y_33790 [Streptomyces sp. NPDC058877]|uniref:hypothetical protein n=1 Tax=Streptomyces sp. NPDC058877 TaxID=3346665 RepID=UPI0036CEF2EE
MRPLRRGRRAVLAAVTLAALLLGGCTGGAGDTDGRTPEDKGVGQANTSGSSAVQDTTRSPVVNGSPAGPAPVDQEELARMQELLDGAESAANDADTDTDTDE